MLNLRPNSSDSRLSFRNSSSTGTLPTHQEIADHFGFRSRTLSRSILRLIRQKGFLESSTGKARSLRVTSALTNCAAGLRTYRCMVRFPPDSPVIANNSPMLCHCGCGDHPLQANPEHVLPLRVVGDSMIGKFICDGDIAVFEHGPEPRPGQIVAALIDRKNTLKTFLVKNGKLFLKRRTQSIPISFPQRNW